jgi:tripartite-type tricarboxylate transporter receptor subunit TctC
MPHIRSGAILPLAVAAKARLAVLPDVPSAPEAGLPDWEASSWFGVAAPAGTPPAIVKRLAGEIAKAVRQPSMDRFTKESGARMVGDTPEEFSALIRAERRKWGEIIRAANITAN